MLAARSIRRYSSSIRASNEIRREFVNFFESEGHVIVPSTKVVRPRFDEKNPFETPETNQLRGVLTGKEKASPRSPRVVNVQKYLQHNSIGDVGKDLNTLSYYEIMGHWSFNNAYGKETACKLAWTFLTEIMKIPKDHLSVTFFGGNSEVPEDSETGNIWRSIGVPYSIRPMNGSHFYTLNESGLAGVSTRIHHKDFKDSCLWNINFTNYKRGRDGKVLAMDTMHVDTGMRLEDLACVIQGVPSVFETDLFRPIIGKIEQVSGKTYNGRIDGDPRDLDHSFRVVADYSRALCMAIADLQPTTSDHARYIIGQQAHLTVWHAVNVLEAPRGTLKELVPVVVESLGTAYPLMGQRQKKIEETLESQEKRLWSAYDMHMEKSKKYPEGSVWSGPEWFSSVVEKKKYDPSPTRKAINRLRGIIGF